MKRTETIKFSDFMSGEYKRERERDKAVYKRIATATGAYIVIGLPKVALGATATTTGSATFDRLYHVIMNIFDGGVVIALIVAGGSWAFGYRTQAIERLVYIACGYLLARHALDIRDFLKTI